MTRRAFKEEEFSSHITLDNGYERKQSVCEHLRNVAKYTKELLTPMRLGNLGYLVGLLHDMGKFSKEFQEYLWNATHNEPSKRGMVTHTTHGLRYLFDCKKDNPLQTATIEFCGFVIASHHGVMDCTDIENNSGFLKKINNLDDQSYQECKAVFDYFFPNVQSLLQDATKELNSYLKLKTGYFYGLLARMVLSALIEADHSDTADFMLERTSKRMDGQKIRATRHANTVWRCVNMDFRPITV